MIEDDISIESGGASLSGTLCLPAREGSYPIVLMVHGSGPLDRNGNCTGQTLDIFNTLAHSFAAMGISSLRYDKRGCFRSSGNYFKASHSDFVTDAVRWAEELHRLNFLHDHNLYLLGHSEGAVIAPQVHSQTSVVSGLILLCPFVSDFESMLLNQAAQLDKETANSRGLLSFYLRLLSYLTRSHLSTQKLLINSIKQSDSKVIESGQQKISARWFQELFDLNVQKIYQNIECPTLLIGAGKDLQCDPADVIKIEELSNAPVQTKLFPKLTHLLRFDEQEAAFSRYPTLLKRPVEKELIDLLGNWIKHQELRT